MSRPSKSARKDTEQYMRERLDAIFDEAEKQGRILLAEDAMRKLERQLTDEFPRQKQADTHPRDPEIVRENERTMGALYLYASKRCVQAVNRAEGIRPGRPRLSPEEITEMDRLVKEGKSNQAVADKLGITRDAVLKRKRAAKRARERGTPRKDRQ